FRSHELPGGSPILQEGCGAERGPPPAREERDARLRRPDDRDPGSPRRRLPIRVRPGHAARVDACLPVGLGRPRRARHSAGLGRGEAGGADLARGGDGRLDHDVSRRERRQGLLAPRRDRPRSDPLQLRAAGAARAARGARGGPGRPGEDPDRGAGDAPREGDRTGRGSPRRAGGVTTESLDELARRAREGQGESLERLVAAIQDRIHGLALRMLWHPEDARDATQEILIRIVTRLGTFRGASSFTTWAHRVAANYLLTVRKSRLERQAYTFRRFGEELDEGLSDAPAPPAPGDAALLLEEVKIGCTLGMLTCLDRPHRLAYVLGEILEMEGDEAARVLGIRPAAFRKRLSRAREAVVAFTRAKCGLVSP